MAQSDLSPVGPSPELAYEHLLEAAERRGLALSVVPDHHIEGFLARINMRDKVVEVAWGMTHDLEQLVMILAHELGHAFDPHYRMTWMFDSSGSDLAESEREVVAQTAAKEFCSLYRIDVRRASELYIRLQRIRMSRLLRLRADVSLCSMLPASKRTRNWLLEAKRRWQYRWIPFVARRPLPKDQPLLKYRSTSR